MTLRFVVLPLHPWLRRCLCLVVIRHAQRSRQNVPFDVCGGDVAATERFLLGAHARNMGQRTAIVHCLSLCFHYRFTA